jgi:hypothetical protein
MLDRFIDSIYFPIFINLMRLFFVFYSLNKLCWIYLFVNRVKFNLTLDDRIDISNLFGVSTTILIYSLNGNLS